MKIGDLKSLCSLWTNLAANHRYSPFVNERDIQTFNDRVACEGLTFLTTTLPSIGKSLDSFHSTMVWTPPVGFKTEEELFRFKDPDGIEAVCQVPLFLGDAIRRALEGDSAAVDCVRQLTFIFYKLEADYDPVLIEQFLADFKRIDKELFSMKEPTDRETSLLLDCMRTLIGVVLANADPLDIRPCHGSGATADRVQNWDKYHRLSYYAKLDAVFPYPEYFFYSASHLVDEIAQLEEAKVAVPRARICLVPKDSRGPRVISCEPAELMYVQQGLMRLLYKTMEAHPLTSGQINFTDQSINRLKARIGSRDGTFATIDLSEASDRVSLDLIRRVFPSNWVEALEATRSEETELPNGEILKLNKFAPMGSSCCFPVEALVFWACAKASIYTSDLWKGRYPWKIGPSKDLFPEVYVYGDDIAFETRVYEPIVVGLSRVGLVVNLKKSYWKGPFRESCGGDYHNDFDVTPVRVRKPLTLSSTSLLSTGSDLCNTFIAKFGYDNTIATVSIIESELGYIYPRSLLQLPCCIYATPRASNDVLFRRRWNSDFQRYEHRILTTATNIRQRRPRNWGELLRKELTRGIRESKAEDYRSSLAIVDAALDPGQYADPHSVRTKWAWVWLG